MGLNLSDTYDIKDRIFSFMLALVPGVGDVTISSLLEVFGTPKEIFKADRKTLEGVKGVTKKKTAEIIKYREKTKETRAKVDAWDKSGIKAAFIFEDTYPDALKNLADAPFAIFYKGQLPLDTAPTVAIVGARGCSDYGKNVAFSLGRQLALEGVQIVSGMAAGTDHYGHKGALAGGGYTAGVLGCGVDICYPRSNINTYFEMQKTGCVMSEVLPGTDPFPGLFPRRNRLIAALSDAVIIVEARERSGSLITADQALEQGKYVFAVPGRIGDPLSRGCLTLIKQGAVPLTCLNDVLECEGIKMKTRQKGKKKNCDPEVITDSKKITHCGDDSDKKVLRSLTDIPKNINRIMYETGLSYESAAQAIINLELEGMLRSISAGLYVRAFA